jgi:uncharacterized protein (TIGR02117 family)
VAVALTGIRWGDGSVYPASADEDVVEILLVSNGFHSGLLLPRAALADTARREGRDAVVSVAGRFRAYDAMEVGWGDNDFYRETPNIDALDWKLGLRALLGLGGGSVMHVMGVSGDPRALYSGTSLIRVPLSQAGFGKLLERLEASFARDEFGSAVELGTGLGGPSLFYRANGTFFFGRLCNHWTAGLLGSAGVPTSPLLATIPNGIVWDLTLRSRLSVERPTLSPATAAQ